MNKKIVVHIGPPKTGTSVLQNWFVNNIDFLDANKIYYPNHKVNSLGISSGNVREVLDFDNEGKSVFSHEKFNKLIKKFTVSDYDYLLISSEYFFYQIDGFLKNKLDIEIRFVAYIRPEFEFVESIYNQAIKRNYQTKSFDRRKELKNLEISRIIDYVTKYDKKYFSLRAYGNKGIFEGDIVDDFLSEFNLLKDQDSKQLPIINSSYGFECLEFKRWLNQYCNESMTNQLDVLLQGVSWGNKNYSLLPEGLFQSYKQQSLVNIRKLNDICPINNFSLLEEYIKNKNRKPYVHQALAKVHFDKVVNNLLKTNRLFIKKIINHINTHTGEHSDDYVKRLEVLYINATEPRSIVKDNKSSRTKLLRSFYCKLLNKLGVTESN